MWHEQHIVKDTFIKKFIRKYLQDWKTYLETQFRITDFRVIGEDIIATKYRNC